MNGKEIKNLSASVMERLRHIAESNNADFNHVARQFVQERFLYRLSQSNVRDNFILKGALLFVAWDINRNRPTRDIDFMASQIKNDAVEMSNTIKRFLAVEFQDGVSFLTGKLRFESITEGADYKGIRIHIPCLIGNMRIPLQMDIGFGDIIVNAPDLIEFPVLLDFPAPVVRTYSVESSIAEKFQAIVSLGKINSRMKDYYDILYIAGQRSFNGEILSKAIRATFKNRHTDLLGINSIFNSEFKQLDKLSKLWSTFSRQRELPMVFTFEQIVTRLEHFLQPASSGILHSGMTWNPETFTWETEN